MSKVQNMKQAIGMDVFRALGLAGDDKIGYVVRLADERTMTALRVHGVIGKNDGLTILGSALAAQARAQILDELF